MDNLFSRVVDGSAEPPGLLPFEATTSAGEPRTDLWGQFEAGYLTLTDLADMDLWPATLDEVAFDPETEAATDLVMTLDAEARTVAAVRGKRALTADELAEREAIRNPVPDGPSLGDWRVALVLWKRLPEVLARIKALVDAGNPLGVVAQERVEYSNHVQRAQLMQLKDVVGFTAAEVDESLHRADRVAKGDLSGVWPLPAA